MRGWNTEDNRRIDAGINRNSFQEMRDAMFAKAFEEGVKMFLKTAIEILKKAAK